MAVSVIVPWRGGCPHREAAWAWLRPRYEALGWQVVVGECPTDEWCKAEAVAEALPFAKGDVLVVADADVWCDRTVNAVEAMGHFKWAVPHRSTRRLSQESTTTVLDGGEFGGALVEPSSRAHPGGGIVVLKRSTYDGIPLDPRFIGWGYEDDAWGQALRTLAGPPAQTRGTLWHLWHPPQWRHNRYLGNPENLALFRRYDEAFGRPSVMSDLMAEVTNERSR